jgi:hypothetical protein
MKRASDLKLMRRQLEKENAKRPELLTSVDKSLWPTDGHDNSRTGCMVSKKYMVQIFDEHNGVIRISCNRTSINQFGQWEENLSWDELMEIKRQAGYGDRYAVEVLPGDDDIVNVANMRHFWVMPHPIVGWRKK